MATELLSPFIDTPQQPAGPNGGHVLIVGSDGAGKTTLAKALRKNSADVDLHIHLATRLPLPPSKQGRARFDFSIYAVDLTNRASLESCERALESTSETMTVLGRAAIVATHTDLKSKHSVRTYEVEELSAAYSVPVFWADLVEDESRKTTADILARCVRLAQKGEGLAMGTLDCYFVDATSITAAKEEIARKDRDEDDARDETSTSTKTNKGSANKPAAASGSAVKAAASVGSRRKSVGSMPRYSFSTPLKQRRVSLAHALTPKVEDGADPTERAASEGPGEQSGSEDAGSV